MGSVTQRRVRRNSRTKSKFNFNTCRRREIERRARRIGAADSEDLIRWLIAWVWHNPDAKDQVFAVLEAARRMGRKGMQMAEAAKIIEEAGIGPKFMKAGPLGKYLGLTYVLRQELNITTIAPCNMGPRARAEHRKFKNMKAEARRRRERGAIPRSEYEANSLSTTQPWLAEGISRSTWERRRNKTRTAAAASADASPCTAVLFNNAASTLASLKRPQEDFRGKGVPSALPTSAVLSDYTTMAAEEPASIGEKNSAVFARRARDGTRRGLQKDWGVRDRILTALDGGKPKTVNELIAEAGIRNRRAADLLMFKLTKTGAVERTGRGVYQIRRAA